MYGATLLMLTAGAVVGAAALDERFWFTTWIVFAFVFWFTSRAPAEVAFRRWFAFGVAGCATGFHWLPELASAGLRVSIVSGVAAAAVPIAWDGLRFGLFGWGCAKLTGPGAATLSSALVRASLWMLLEWGWPHVFPWHLGMLQLGFLPICQVAEFAGAGGVGFLLVASTSALAHSLRQERSPARLVAPAVTGAAVVAACVGGSVAIRTINAADAEATPYRVALLQPGTALDQPDLCELTERVGDSVDLAVWPESSVAGYAESLDDFSDAAQREAAQLESVSSRPFCDTLPACELLVNGVTFGETTREAGPFRNTTRLLGVEGRVLGVYHKRQLMPWGEYAVGQQFFPGLNDLLVEKLYLPGESAEPIVTAAGVRLGVLICYEDLQAGPSNETVRLGAEVLVNQNNLQNFMDTPAAWQHRQLARFRAIESRRWLLRCGQLRATALIDATGRVRQQADPVNAEALTGSVALRRGLTPYVRAPLWPIALGGLIVVVAVVRRATALAERTTGAGDSAQAAE